jgi:hypothetical protein
MLEEGFVPWPGSPEENARRFMEAADGRREIDLPGDIAWFDLGPAADEEIKRLSA